MREASATSFAVLPEKYCQKELLEADYKALFSALCRAVLAAKVGLRSDRSGRLPLGHDLLKKINARSPGRSLRVGGLRPAWRVDRGYHPWWRFNSQRFGGG